SALTNCAKLSRKKPFLDLSSVFGKWLRVYANDVLLSKLPKHIISACTKALVRAVENHYEPALQSMAKLPWATIENVGDQSGYVSMIQATLKTCVGAIQELITNKRYFRTFCDKFIESFVARFAINLTKCKPISEIGAEQMLLDTQAVKSLLLEIPNLGSESSVPVPASFIKFVTRGLGKIETVLKTAMSPHEPVDMFIDHYFLLIGDRNLANFQRILELKGLKRSEQQQMVDLFQKKQVGMESLSDNSAVMSLLQSMPAHISNQGVVGPSAGLVGNMTGIVLGGVGGSSSSSSGSPVGLMTPSGASGNNSGRDNSPYQLGNIVTSSILSHSPFAALAAQHSNSPGSARTSGEQSIGNSSGGLFGLGQDRDSNVGAGSGVAGAGGSAVTSPQSGSGGGSFAASAKINVNFRKFVAGMRAKKDQDSGSVEPSGN
ncbi:Vacuolar protein sorting-associated protein 53, partial [Lobosporangium transversale]